MKKLRDSESRGNRGTSWGCNYLDPKLASPHSALLNKTRRVSLNKKSSRGFTLVEVVVATVMMVFLVLAISLAMQWGMKGLVVSRQQMRAARTARTIHAQLQSMDFFQLFSCDSSRTDFGLTATGVGGLHSASYPFINYPSSAALQAMQQSVQVAGFDHFDLSVSFLRRDRSALRTAGVTSNVIPFVDTTTVFGPVPASLCAYTTGDGFDDSDAALCYQDINGDGDYFDTYFIIATGTVLGAAPAGCFIWQSLPLIPLEVYYCDTPTAIPGGYSLQIGRRKTEMPDTRLKQVNLRLWNNKTVVHKEGWLISEAGLSGRQMDEWESKMFINMSQPIFPTTIYSKNPFLSPQWISNWFGTTLKKPFPANAPAVRADVGAPLQFKGETVPLSNVGFSTAPQWTSGGVFPWMDAGGPVNATGLWALNAPNITAALIEGRNRLGGYAWKPGIARSPIWADTFIFDKSIPLMANETPVHPSTNPVKTLTPFVGLQFYDDTASTSNVSGICPEVIWVGTGSSAANASTDEAQHLYMDGWAVYQSSWVVVASPNSGLMEPLPDNAFTYVYIEGADRAHFGNKSDWRFRVKIDNPDGTPPTLGCVVSAGVTPTITCTLNDPDSGVNWKTIDFGVYHLAIAPPNKIAAVNVTDTPRMGDFFDPKPIVTGGILRYRFTAPLSIGHTYWITLKAKNWAGDASLVYSLSFVP